VHHAFVYGRKKRNPSFPLPTLISYFRRPMFATAALASGNQATHPHCENTTIETAARIAESARYVRLNAL